MVSHIWPRVRGSSPVVGSSRKISGGRVIRLAARSSRRRMPPENWRDRLGRPPPRGRTARAGLGARSRASARSSPWSRPNSIRFSVAVRFSSTEAYWPGDAEELADDVAGRGVRRCRRSSRRPRRSGSSVASILSIVVLPAPLGPRTPKTSPRRTSRSTPSTASLVAEGLDQAVGLDGQVGWWGCGEGVVMSEACGRPVSRQFHGRTQRAAELTPRCTGLRTGLAGNVVRRRGATTTHPQIWMMESCARSACDRGSRCIESRARLGGKSTNGDAPSHQDSAQRRRGRP